MSPTAHLESSHSSTDFTTTTTMDHTSLSKTASLPALPPRSALRASRIISSYDLSARLSEPITLDTAPKPSPSPSTTPELSPSDPNPYDSSSDDDSADELDHSTLSIVACPSGEHAHEHDAGAKGRNEDVARVVEFMFVGKPTVVSIALCRPPTSDSAKLPTPVYPPRRDSRPVSTAAAAVPPTPTDETPPQLPRRPNLPRLSLVPSTASAGAAKSAGARDYPHASSRASMSTPALPFLNTDPFGSAASTPTSATASLRSPEVVSPASSFMGSVRRGLAKGAGDVRGATLRRMPSMGRLGRRESVGGEGMGRPGMASAGVSVVSLVQVGEEEREEGGEKKTTVTYDDIVRGAIHGPPPLPVRPAPEKEVLSPRLWGGMMGLGRR